MVEVDRNIGSFEVIGVSPVLVQEPVTLAGVINGVDLKHEEMSAVLAADAMSIPLEQKGILVGADIFLRDGIFRANEVLGFDRDQSVEARDLVRIDPSYEVSWIQFNLLKQENFAGVAIHKRVGMSHEAIAQELEINVEDVDAIVKGLDEYGIFGNKKSHEIKHVYIRDQVAQNDAERRKFDLPLLANAELGNRHNRSKHTISRFRAEIRDSGGESTLSLEEQARRSQIIRDAIIKNPNLSGKRMLDLISAMGLKDITREVVYYHRTCLINEKLIERRGQSAVKGKSRAQIVAESEAILNIFQSKLRELLQIGEPIVIADVRRSNPVLAAVPNDTLVKIYHRIAASGEEVPPLKFDRTRKNKR